MIARNQFKVKTKFKAKHPDFTGLYQITGHFNSEYVVDIIWPDKSICEVIMKGETLNKYYVKL